MNGVSGVSSSTATISSASQKMGLGKNEFLKLLTKQLQNQNPLEPMDNAGFIAQLATFSQLEQLINMNESFSSFMNSSTKSSALFMLGKEVKGTTVDGTTVVAKAMAVEFKEGKTIVTLEGDIKVPFENILKVKEV
jgi:flagellar basal-body rod modification protein FlgD